MIAVVRISLGAFDFEAVPYFTEFQESFYYYIFITMVITTCIIFLNFIIAQVSDTYMNVV
jgi:hypothetical protein